MSKFEFSTELHILAIASVRNNSHDEKIVILDNTAPYEFDEQLGYNPFEIGYDSLSDKWSFELLDDDAVNWDEVEVRECDGEPWLAILVNEDGDWNNRLGVKVKEDSE